MLSLPQIKRKDKEENVLEIIAIENKRRKYM